MWRAMKTKDFILLLWQLPQEAAGSLVARRARTVDTRIYRGCEVHVTGGPGWKESALGHHVFTGRWSAVTAAHGYGHSVLSKRWGWLYIPVVWLSAEIRRRHCKGKDRFSLWPESAADRLGGVRRDRNGRRYVKWTSAGIPE